MKPRPKPGSPKPERPDCEPERRPRWSFTFRRHDTDEIPTDRFDDPIYSIDVTSFTADDPFADALSRARDKVAEKARLVPAELYCVGACAENYAAAQVCNSYSERRKRP